ncbi:hypothetical protein FRC07_001948, partial [Ceratobasidium sp. 392]
IDGTVNSTQHSLDAMVTLRLPVIGSYNIAHAKGDVNEGVETLVKESTRTTLTEGKTRFWTQNDNQLWVHLDLSFPPIKETLKIMDICKDSFSACMRMLTSP